MQQAHADANAPVAAASAATQKQTVSQSEYDAQKQVVASDTEAVRDQQANVDTASDAVAGATTANSNVNAVTSAQAADQVAQKNYTDLQSKVESENNEIGSLATKTETKSNSAMAKDWETNGAIAKSQATEKFNSANAAVDAATKAQNTTFDDMSAALSDTRSDAKVASDAAVAQTSAEQAYNDALTANANSETLKQLSDAARDAKVTTDKAKAAVKADEDAYNVAAAAHKKAAQDRLSAENDKTAAQVKLTALAGEEKAYNEYTANVAKLAQLRAQRDADKARLKVVKANAEKAHADATKLAKDLLVPTTQDEADQYQADANNASNWMAQYKQDAAYTQHQTDVQSLKNAQDELATNQQKLANAEQQLKEDQAKLDQAKKDLAAATTDKEKQVAQTAVDDWTGYVQTDKDNVATFNNWIKGSQANVDAAQAALTASENSAAYKNVMQAINDCQAKIDANKTAQANWEAYKNGAANLTALQAKLAQEQQTLKDLQDLLAKDQAVLDNMVVEGSTGDHTNNGDATKPGENTKANQGNSNATATAGQKSNVSVKANGKKVFAATKAKAKKLPQTGNNSAAVVALGALTGMLGLGLAAKKREF